MSNDDVKLDRLLWAPLAPVADNGFSARVMMKLAGTESRESWLEAAVLVSSGCVLLAVLPVAGLSEWIERVSAGIAANSLPLTMAALALALTWSYTRVLAD